MFDDLETMARNSFFDFHAKGMDYVCLKRTPQLTIKAYFFDEDSYEHACEVVNPHDHRYDFRTEVLRGKLIDSRYLVKEHVGLHEPAYQQFSWHTPLNGGTGFQWRRQVGLTRVRRQIKLPGDYLHSSLDTIHTIEVERGTVLLLYQFADKMPQHWTTNTYVKGSGKEPPSLDGLYRKPGVDEICKRLVHLSNLGVPLRDYER